MDNRIWLVVGVDNSSYGLLDFTTDGDYLTDVYQLNKEDFWNMKIGEAGTIEGEDGKYQIYVLDKAEIRRVVE